MIYKVVAKMDGLRFWRLNEAENTTMPICDDVILDSQGNLQAVTGKLGDGSPALRMVTKDKAI